MNARFAFLRKNWLVFAAITAGWLLLVGLCYRDTNCTFLRAESGWYQAVAHSGDTDRMAAMQDFFRHSHNGHYMPFAVLAEIETTRLFGMHAKPWKWRAILAIALLGGALSSLIYRVTLRSGAPRSLALASSFALTSLLLLHPLLREFVAFPTLIYQLTWMLLFVITLRAFLEAVAHPEQARWVWLAAACSYISMHTVGLGAVTATATAAVLGLVLLATSSGKLPQFAPKRGHWLTAFLLLVLLSSLHLAAMQFLRPFSEFTSAGQSLHSSTMLGFVVCLILRVLECLLGTSDLAYFSVASLESQWPYGVAAIVVGLSLWSHMLRRTMAAPVPERVARCLLHSFSFFAFITLLVLVAARVPFESDSDWFRAYLTNPRYIVPATLILLPSVIALTTTFLQRHTRVLILCSAVIVVALFAGNQTYYYNVYRRYPTASLVHEKTWKRIVAMAQECRAAHLPVPDVPTRALGEFPWHLHNYDSLLRYSLGLTTGDRIEYDSWKSFDAPTTERYLMAVPSFQLVLTDLRLQTKSHGTPAL